MSATLDLFPAALLQPPLTEVELALLPADTDIIGDAPSEAFVNDIRKRGVRSPVMLVEDGKGGYKVCFGTRRIKAARKCKLKTIPARIYPAGMVNPHSEALAENNQREENVARDVAAIADLREQGHTDETIQKELRLNVSRFRSRCKILDLPDRLLNLLYEGRMSGSAAEAAAKLTTHLQERLLEVLEAKQAELDTKGAGKTARLSATDVREVSRAASAAARASVDPDLFATPDADEEEPAPDDPRKLIMDAFQILVVQLPMELIREADALCGKYVAYLRKHQEAPPGEEEEPMSLMPIQTPRVLPDAAPKPQEPVQEPPKKGRGRKRQKAETGSLLGEE
jgi:ParB/RepB/Spo0J family partition protein